MAATTAVKQGHSLTLERRLKAAPDQVWRAWTDPQALMRWFAPSDDFETPTVECDLRVGGRYRIVMKSPDGELHDVRGVYREIVPNERLVFSWAWQSEPDDESIVTITLRPDGAGTELTLQHDKLPSVTSRDKHQHGWIGCLDRLERDAL
jgi:uncharacterized protein YndB with AHSA1/START domain